MNNTIYIFGLHQHKGIEIKNVSSKDQKRLDKILTKYEAKIRTEQEVLRGYTKTKAKEPNFELTRKFVGMIQKIKTKK